MMIKPHDDEHQFSKKSGSLEDTFADAKGRKASCQLTCCRLHPIIIHCSNIGVGCNVVERGFKYLIQENDILMTERDTLQGEIHRVTAAAANPSKYKPLMKGYDASNVTQLYNESETINKENKYLAEAIRLDELTNL